MMSWMSTPAFAGHNPMGHGKGHGHEVGTSGSPQEARVIKVGRRAVAIISIPRTTHTATRAARCVGSTAPTRWRALTGRKGGRTPPPIIPAIATRRTTPKSSANRPTGCKLMLAERGARPAAQKSSGSSRKL
jgi:hypothetical protein